VRTATLEWIHGQLWSRGRTSGRTSIYAIYRLVALRRDGFAIERLPYSLRILLENLLRTENGSSVTRTDVEPVAWSASSFRRLHMDYGAGVWSETAVPASGA
jgi:aconitase A